MQVALEDMPETPMPIPDGIVTMRIDRNSGKLTRRTDHTSMFEYFLKGTEPDVYVLDAELVDPLESGAQTGSEPEEIF